MNDSMTVYEAKPFFSNRADAGRRLADKLSQYRGGDVIILAVPRGGVPVAIEVARGLDAPLGVVVARKITIPYNPEAGYGAVTEDGTVVLNEPLVRELALPRHQIERQAKEVQDEIKRRCVVYRRSLPIAQVKGRTAIVIDDGLASGFTMLAAIKSMEREKASRTVVATPVASGKAYDLVKPAADNLVCLVIARTYPFAVASFYDYWYDLSDEEVMEHLEAWRTECEGR